MEMLERCPGCSVAREAEPAKAESGPKPPGRCEHCGYDGPFPAAEAGPRLRHPDSIPSFAGARAKLATATQDLFRLSGNHSIPVEAAAAPEPPAPPPPAEPSAPPTSSARKPEQSIMFSLEALMKANSPSPSAGPSAGVEEVSDQLWSMQAATPLFGTAHDQALLTTPLKMEPAPSMDSMTLPSHAPNGRRWLPILLAACGGLALAGTGIWAFASKDAASASVATQAPPATLEAPPSEPAAAATPAPVENAAVTEPTPAEVSAGALPAAEGALGEPGAGGAPAGAAVVPESAPPASAEPEAEGPKVTAPEKDKPVSKRVSARPAPSSTNAAFDKGAAKSALNAAASEAARCGAGGAPGKGKIQVTFAASGKVSDARLVEGPFGGTAAGKCALRHFKAARVPAFSGAPVTVAKSFKVE